MLCQSNCSSSVIAHVFGSQSPPPLTRIPHSVPFQNASHCGSAMLEVVCVDWFVVGGKCQVLCAASGPPFIIKWSVGGLCVASARLPLIMLMPPQSHLTTGSGSGSCTVVGCALRQTRANSLLAIRNYRNYHQCVEGRADRNNKKECM